MRTTILLSPKRDPDLIALYRKIGNSEFSNMIKDSLRTIIRGGYKGATKLHGGFVLQGAADEDTIKINLILTAAKDEDVRELLSHVLPGKRGTFVKQALRFYMGPAAVFSGFMDSEFSGKLQDNPVPVQVFAIGEFKTETKKTKKRTQKSVQINKRPGTVIEKDIAPTEVFRTEEAQAFSGFSQPKIDTVETSPVKTADGTSEEDAMLSMLEGLLG